MNRAASTMPPPSSVCSEGTSPRNMNTHSGVKGTSSAASNVASAAGTRFEPKV